MLNLTHYFTLCNIEFKDLVKFAQFLKKFQKIFYGSHKKMIAKLPKFFITEDTGHS